MITLIALLITHAVAVQNLPCNRDLSSEFAENEIVIKGPLDAFWETGMEDQTGWSAVDTVTKDWLSRDPWDSQFFLKEGDYITVEISGVIYRGYYKEKRERQNFTFNGQPTVAYPNIPHLTDSQGKDVIDPEIFQRVFFNAFNAQVVRKLNAQDLEALNEKHKFWRELNVRFEHKRNIDVGNGNFHIAPHFAQIGRGELIETASGSIKIKTPKGEVDFYPNDTLYVDEGGQTSQFKIHSFPWKGDDEIRRLMSRPHKAIVIR